MPAAPRLIASEIYRRSNVGRRHPLGIPRVSTVVDLVRVLGWVKAERYHESRPAPVAALGRFHTPDYLAALREAERTQRLPADMKARYNLGRFENPFYPEMFRRPATTCGATLLGVDLLLSGAAPIVHSPAGGTHHGRPGRAAGFCYLNDPVLGILALLDAGVARVAYVDIDAHHGDGVEDAFADDARVLTVSVHEAGRWPMRKGETQRQTGTARNVAVPAGFNDSEMRLVADRVLEPLVAGFRPEVLVLQCGADGLAEDPLSRLALSNNAHVEVARRLAGLAPRLLVLGGGGYNPWSVARLWTRIWAALDGRAEPARLPPRAEAVLRALRWRRRAGRNPPEAWSTTLVDPPREGPISRATTAAVAAALAAGGRMG